MVMIAMSDRTRDWLGTLEEDEEGWWIRPTELGKAVARCWDGIELIWEGVEVRVLQLMPEHLHGILRVLAMQRHPLGQIIGSFKAKSTAAARALGGASVPSGVRSGGSLWEPGFQDSILWTNTRYQKSMAYLLDNPRRLAVKRAHPDLFRVARDIAIDLGEGRIGHFSAIGNHFLLDKYLVQVQISRRHFGYLRIHDTVARDGNGNPVAAFRTAEYEERRTAFFTAAKKEGAVLLSPCVSDGERQIAREALAAGIPLVTMHNKGFSSLQKPPGRYFDACAEGRLLMLAPAAWPYLPGAKPMTRNDALAMNHLCQWLAGDGAAEIRYQGLNPRDIDRLAREAARI